MNIGYYGHSSCAYRSEHSHIDIISKRFDADIVNIGARQGSEERILYELKKTKDLDFAVVFHSGPIYIFLPNCDRDISAVSIDRPKAKFLYDICGFDSTFDCQEDIINFAKMVRTHLYNSDLFLNRYHAAMTQIDQYLSYKKIPAVHVFNNEGSIPSWLTFGSGPVDSTTISKIMEEHEMKNPFFVNCVSQEGNILIADQIEKYIKQEKKVEA